MYILKHIWGNSPPVAKETSYNRFFSIFSIFYQYVVNMFLYASTILVYLYAVLFYLSSALCVILACTLVIIVISCFPNHHSVLCVIMYNFCQNVSSKSTAFWHILMSRICNNVSSKSPLFRHLIGPSDKISWEMTYITLNEKIISELRTISDAVGYLKLLEKKCWYFYPKIMSFLNENMKIKRRIFKHYGYGRKESWWRGGGVHSGHCR